LLAPRASGPRRPNWIETTKTKAQCAMIDGFNISFFAGGIATGLSVGVLCLSACSCLLLPLFLSRKQSFLRSCYIFLAFSAGRLLAYVAFGAASGWLGAEFSSLSWFNWVVAAGYLIAALLLMRFISKDSPLCSLERKTQTSKKSSLPFILGVTTGVNFCPPFVLAVTVALDTKSVFWGGLYFFAFFLGTSVYLLPLIFAGVLTRWNLWRRIGKLAGAVVGFVYIFIALSTFHSLLCQKPVPELLRLNDAGCENFKVIDTRELEVDAIGYAGKTPLVLMVSKSGIISNIFLLENQESDYAVVPASKWLKQWENNSMEFLRENVRKVDGISGATLTIDALRENLHSAARSFVDEGALTDYRLPITDYRFIKTALPFIVLFIIALFVSKIPRLQKSWMRWCLWILSVTFLGLYRSTFFSIEQISLLVRGNIPPLINVSWYAVFLITIVSPLFFGRVYCRYVCPFGALSEICYRIVPGDFQLPGPTAKILDYMKYVLLFAAVILMVVFSKFPVEKFEPFHAVFTRNQPRTYFIFGVSVLIVSCFIKRFWCSFFCLDGALLEIIK